MLPLPGECGCGYVKYEMALGALHIDVSSLLPASSHGLTSHIRIRVPLECTFSYREADGGSRCGSGTFSACATASCWNQPQGSSMRALRWVLSMSTTASSNLCRCRVAWRGFPACAPSCLPRSFQCSSRGSSSTIACPSRLLLCCPIRLAFFAYGDES